MDEAGRLGNDRLAQIADSCINALQSKDIQELLTKPDGNVKVYCEQEFALRVEKGTRFADVEMEEPTDIRGSIDRLVVHTGDDGSPIRAAVIDWKTDSFDPNDRGEKEDYYAPQLASYRQAAALLLGIAVESVTAQLVFVKTAEVVDITEKARVSTV